MSLSATGDLECVEQAYSAVRHDTGGRAGESGPPGLRRTTAFQQVRDATKHNTSNVLELVSRVMTKTRRDLVHAAWQFAISVRSYERGRALTVPRIQTSRRAASDELGMPEKFGRISM